jgi:hypothetical protein
LLFVKRSANFFRNIFFRVAVSGPKAFPCQRGGKIVVEFGGHKPFATVFLKKSLPSLRFAFILRSFLGFSAVFPPFPQEKFL